MYLPIYLCSTTLIGVTMYTHHCFWVWFSFVFILKYISVFQYVSLLFGFIQRHFSPASLENNFWKGTIFKTKSNTLESKNGEEEKKLIYIKAYKT